MKNSPKRKFIEIAEGRNWSIAFAEGYVDGEALRKRGKSPPKFLLVAIDQYSLGFRAGYFLRKLDARPAAAGKAVDAVSLPAGCSITK